MEHLSHQHNEARIVSPSADEAEGVAQNQPEHHTELRDSLAEPELQEKVQHKNQLLQAKVDELTNALNSGKPIEEIEAQVRGLAEQIALQEQEIEDYLVGRRLVTEIFNSLEQRLNQKEGQTGWEYNKLIDNFALLGDYRRAEEIVLAQKQHEGNGNYPKYGYKRIADGAMKRGDIDSALRYLKKCDDEGLYSEYTRLYTITNDTKYLVKAREQTDILAKKHPSLAVDQYFRFAEMTGDPEDIAQLRELIYNSPRDNDKYSGYDHPEYNSQTKSHFTRRGLDKRRFFALTHDPEDMKYQRDSNHGTIHGVLELFGPAIQHHLQLGDSEAVHKLVDEAKKGVWFTETQAMLTALQKYIIDNAGAEFLAQDQRMPGNVRGRAYAELFAQNSDDQQLYGLAHEFLTSDGGADTTGFMLLYGKTGNVEDLQRARESAHSYDDLLTVARATGDTADIESLREKILSERVNQEDRRLLELSKISHSPEDIGLLQTWVENNYTTPSIALGLFELSHSPNDLQRVRRSITRIPDITRWGPSSESSKIDSRAAKEGLKLFTITREQQDLFGLEELGKYFNKSELDTVIQKIVKQFNATDKLDVARDIVRLQKSPTANAGFLLQLELAKVGRQQEDYETAQKMCVVEGSSNESLKRFSQLYEQTKLPEDYQNMLDYIVANRAAIADSDALTNDFLRVIRAADFIRIFGSSIPSLYIRALEAENFSLAEVADSHPVINKMQEAEQFLNNLVSLRLRLAGEVV